MSSLVQAKCTNSRYGANAGNSAMRSLMKYSMALTSWLVVASIALTRAASVKPKPATIARSCALAASSKAGTSVTADSLPSAISHSISTRTRRAIRPYSLNTPRSGSILLA